MADPIAAANESEGLALDRSHYPTPTTRRVGRQVFTLIPWRSYQAVVQGWRVVVFDVTNDVIGPVAARTEPLGSPETAQAIVDAFNDGSSPWVAKIRDGHLSHEGETLLATARQWG